MFNNPPDHFKEGIHVQMLINRDIGNSNKGSRRWVNKLISTNKEEYDKNVEVLIKQQEYQSLVDNPMYPLRSVLMISIISPYLSIRWNKVALCQKSKILGKDFVFGGRFFFFLVRGSNIYVLFLLKYFKIFNGFLRTF